MCTVVISGESIKGLPSINSNYNIMVRSGHEVVDEVKPEPCRKPVYAVITTQVYVSG